MPPQTQDNEDPGLEGHRAPQSPALPTMVVEAVPERWRDAELHFLKGVHV